MKNPYVLNCPVITVTYTQYYPKTAFYATSAPCKHRICTWGKSLSIATSTTCGFDNIYPLLWRFYPRICRLFPQFYRGEFWVCINARCFWCFCLITTKIPVRLWKTVRILVYLMEQGLRKLRRGYAGQPVANGLR